MIIRFLPIGCVNRIDFARRTCLNLPFFLYLLPQWLVYVNEPFFYEVFLDTREKLDSLIAQACATAGVELIECDRFKAGKREVLRIYIDKPNGVDVEDCALVSEHLSDALDSDESLIPDAYTLEVSSPGLDRPLKSTRDFERNKNRIVRVTRSEGRPLTGELVAVDEENLTLSIKGVTDAVLVPRSEILSVKVEVQF
ncbi:MAG: ribosome maturation factor RimP [Fibrobacteraceae bacterium]|nr:ribosome maturation factor RimP [Fibrobacteraceae bacterium]